MSGPAPVSVLMPVLNGAARLGAAIASVRFQEPPPAEIIVIDGGSKDGSAALARAEGASLVLRQSGRGLAQARNEAVKRSSQPFIGFCDSDDLWVPGALAARLELLQRQPETSAVIGQVQRQELRGESMLPLGSPTPGHTPGALLARAHIFAQLGGFDEKYSIAADSDWFIRLREANLNIEILSSVTLLKGVRPDSLSRQVETYRSELLKVARSHIEKRRKR